MADSTTQTLRRIALLGGGAHTIPSYRALIKKLSLHFEIVVYSEFYLGKEWIVAEYKIKSVPKLRMPGRLREFYFGLIVFFDQLIHRADIIHSHSTFPSGFTALIISKIFKIPMLLSLDAAEATGIPQIGFGDLLHPRRIRINKRVVQYASVVTVLTEFQRQQVKLNLTADKEIKVVPRGVDLSKFKFSDHLPQPTVRFLNVGYIHPVKDQLTALRAFEKVKQSISCSLTQIGQDYTNGELKNLCDNLTVQDVKLKGFVPHDQIPPFYGEADVLIHTALYESQGVVIAEALASGVLVCGTHVGLMADLSNSCCLTVQPRDVDGLSKIILELLNNPNRMRELKQNGRTWAEKHDLNWTAHQYVELYQSMMS